MKKIVFLFLFFSSIVLSQTRGISYQALIIDPVTQELPGVNNSSAPLADKNICLKFSIIDELEQLEYEEIFTTRTDDFGMVNLIIGTGTSTGGYAGSFEGILWSALAKNLKVDLSLDEGCSNFTEISNAPFTDVPFALFALNTQDTPLGLDNAADLRLLEALLAATQIGAGLNTDGSYTPDATTNYIRNVTSLKEADTTLDSQVKNNEDNITTNETTINSNTTAIGARVETTSIVDDLTTGGATVPLSAEQGKVLKNLVDTSVNITVENNLNSTNTTNALSANQGSVLKGLLDANTTAITSNTNNINNINTLAAGKVYLGDVNGDAREVVLTGDVTLDNSGVTTITASAVTNAKLDKTNIPLSGFGVAVADVDLGANKLTGVADPTVAQDAATKAYVDAANNINADLTGMVTSMGNVATVVTNANLIGDVTSAGNTTTIGADKVVSAMIVDQTIVADDLATDAITEIKIADANVTNAKLDKINIPLSGFGVADADVALGGFQLKDVADPTVAQDAATKLYVDTATDLNATNITANETTINSNTTAIGERVETTSIVDDLTTGGATVPLSAEQGKVLKNLLDTNVNITVENDLTSASTTNALSANQGRVLKGLVDTNANNISTNNIAIAGAVMTTGDQTVAGAKTFSTTIVGDISGNAATATALETARTIAGNTFDGTGNIAIAATDLSDVTDVGSGAIITLAERTAIGNNATNISDLQTEQNTQNSAIALNTAKSTNVATNLSIAVTTGARTIASSDGTDAVIPVATTIESGVLSTDLFDEIGVNTAKIGISSGQAQAISDNTAKSTNVTTNLSIAVTTGARTIASSDGTDAVIPVATTIESGVLSTDLFDEIGVNTAKIGISSGQAQAISDNTAKSTNVTTNLSIAVTTGARTIASSDGTDAVIPVATTIESGILSTDLFDEIGVNTAKIGISSGQAQAISDNTAKSTNVTTNLSIAVTTGARTIASSDGTDAVIPVATTIESGVLSTDLFDEIGVNTAKIGISSGQAQAISDNTAKSTNVTTNLSIAVTTGARTIASSDGTDAVIPVATTIESGILSTDLFDEIGVNTAKIGISSGQAQAISDNTAKSTNVTTNLSIAVTTGARTIASSDGTDAVIPVATTIESGILSTDLFDEIGVNTAKIGISSGQAQAISDNTAKSTNVTTNLSIAGTTGARTIASSDGTDAVIPVATTIESGVLSTDLFDEIGVNTAKIGISSGQAQAISDNTAKSTNVTTNLSIAGTTGARTIASSDGTDAVIPVATTIESGVLSTDLFDEIGVNTAKIGISSGQAQAISDNTAKSTNVTTNLSIAGTTGARTIASSDGTDAVIPVATTIESGVLSTDLFDEIGVNTAKIGISSGQAQAISDNTAKSTNVTTNLSIAVTTGARTIASSDGTDAVIPVATTIESGVLSTDLFDKLDGIEDLATADQTAAQVVSTPTTNITATNVQDAISQLDAQLETQNTDKLPLAGGTMEGIINMDDNAIDNVSEITMIVEPGKTATITGGAGLTIATTHPAAAGANIEISAAGIAELKGTDGVNIRGNDGAVDITGEGISLDAGAEELTLNSEDGVDIAQANVLTTVKGTLHVVGDVTLNTTLTVVGQITAPTFIGELNGELNGTINTLTTGETQNVGDNSTKIATTEFVASGTSANVSSISNNIQSSSVDPLAATGLAEYSATANIASGSRTFNSSNSANTFNAGIDLGPNSIVTITITQVANYGGANIQPVVTAINTSNNTFDIETYSNGSLALPTNDFTFNFLIIK